MYRDNTLIPTEAVRLLALGLLAEEPRGYAELAREVRHFTARFVGPSLDLVGTPLSLLKVEELIRAEPGEEQGDEALMTITEAGRREAERLLGAGVRNGSSDINKLILAIKLRFLHLLPRAQQALQADMLAEVAEKELHRLRDLRSSGRGGHSHLPDWLELEIAQAEARLEWFEELRRTLERD
jgi:DNA-binding PadR family transcriptional regulator